MHSITVNPSLREEVLLTTKNFSDKFIVEPGLDFVETDLISGLKRFRASVRRKWKMVEEKRTLVEEMKDVFGENDFDDDALDALAEDPAEKTFGLGTGLYNRSACVDDEECGSKEVESFLFELERDLLSQLSQARVKDPRKKKAADTQVLSMLE